MFDLLKAEENEGRVPGSARTGSVLLITGYSATLSGWESPFKQALSINVFIFTSGGSALLGH